MSRTAAKIPRGFGPPLLLLACLACLACSSSDRGLETAVVRIESGDRTWDVPVEVSADPDARHRGWKGRESLPPDRGMIFLYPSSEPRRFWMKGCLVPIDVAFVGDDGRIVNVAEMQPPADPERSERYPSAEPVPVALEMPGGWFRAHGVGPGDRVVLSEALRAVEPR